NAIIGEDNSVTGGLVGAATLLFINYVVVRFLYNHEELDRLVGGEPDGLIENGRVCEGRMRKELITRVGRDAEAHKQGVSSLGEIERCVIESGGGLSFIGRRPTPEAERHAELLARLDQMQTQLAQLRG